MIRPTKRAALLFSVSIPLALLVVSAAGNMWYLSLYYPVIAAALMAADLARALPAARIRAGMKNPSRIYIGERGQIDFSITASGYGAPVALGLFVETEGGERLPEKNATMSGGRAEVSIPFVPRKRGRVALAALWLRWAGPMGLMELWLKMPLNKTIDVIPNARGIHENALAFFARDAIWGLKAQRARGEGTEFEDLREYVQGMDPRLIDWKSSARRRKILCREFCQERNHQIILGFDTGRLMTEPVDGMPKLDHAARAGLALSWVSLFSGDLVGGCGFDARFRAFIKPGRGMTQFARMQTFAAELEYRTEETNFTLAIAELNSRLKQRALVVLFTDFIDTISAELLLESLKWITRRHVVVFVTMNDPSLVRLRDAPPKRFYDVAGAVVAGDFLRERSVVLERVSRLGVHCVDAPAPRISPSLINRYLSIKRMGLL